MAEQYYPGINRIFYKAGAFEEGLIVRVDLFDSNENLLDGIYLTQSDISGLYYFDYLFVEGVYVAVFYENGQKKLPAVYNITSKVTGGGHSIVFSSDGSSLINL